MFVGNYFAHPEAPGPGVNNIIWFPHRLAMAQEAADQAIAIADRIIAEDDWAGRKS